MRPYSAGGPAEVSDFELFTSRKTEDLHISVVIVLTKTKALKFAFNSNKEFK